MGSDLSGLDLSGITGNIYYHYDNAIQYIPSIISVAIFSILAIVFVFWVIVRIEKSLRSKEYRELMSDMYIVGKVKQLAGKDGVNLADEINLYNQINKKLNMRGRSFDYVVEQDLNEKLAEETEKASKK